MEWLRLLSGPIIGAIIGYFTNLIAVKLLFRPLKPIYIGRFQVPFTPGIIPKRKNQIAKSVGEAVGQTLLTPNDIEAMLRAEKVRQGVCNEVMKEMVKLENYNTLGDIALSFAGEEKYEFAKSKVEDFLIKRLLNGIKKIDLEQFLLADGGAHIKEKMKGSIFALFITEDTIKTFAKPLATQFIQLIDEKGPELILPILRDEIRKLEETNTGEALMRIGFEEETARAFILKIYDTIVIEKIANIVRGFDLAGMVEKRIAAMDVLEVEKMLLSVIKKELNAVVNLGAYIGFILGLLNAFF